MGHLAIFETCWHQYRFRACVIRTAPLQLSSAAEAVHISPLTARLKSCPSRNSRRSNASPRAKSKTADKNVRLKRSPSPGLQHVGFVQSGYCQAFHGSGQIFADFK